MYRGVEPISRQEVKSAVKVLKIEISKITGEIIKKGGDCDGMGMEDICCMVFQSETLPED